MMRLATEPYVTTESGLLIPKSIVDAKGDLIVASGPDAVSRMGVGVDGQLLTVDSTQPEGIKWADAPIGGLPHLIDDFVSDTTSEYVWEPGGTPSAFSVSGGKLVSNAAAMTSSERFWHNSMVDVMDFVATMKFRYVGTKAGEVHFIGRWTLDTDPGGAGWFHAGYDGTNLVLYQWDPTAGFTSFGIASPGTISPDTDYWLRVILMHDWFRVEIWNQAPSRTGTGIITGQTITNSAIFNTEKHVGWRGKVGVSLQTKPPVAIDSIDIKATA